ncbi:DUF885 domain-containing protein [Catenulispora sp. NL8]|uniref:DUF885 domain-containing protein n=1 Tax=Catenulispora pinistramenti TaxID=2705254 RepID=A0ABS5L4M7_9ACTN|nr:DUF885 domain-containing protein [Catenulispora pinistramenti]MBS2553310.1 DUF885 domain-containing protein [Catenulispora pinistramenti]
MADTPDARFEALAAEFLDGLCRRRPDWASALGRHEYDAELPDHSAGGLAAESAWLAGQAEEFADLDRAALSVPNRVDAAILANEAARIRFQIDDLREDEWNPAEANPGVPLYTLLARDYAPAAQRLTAFAGRLEQVPSTLSGNRALLAGKALSRIHVELAIGQFEGTAELIGGELDAAVAAAREAGAEGLSEARAAIDAVRPAALAALREHIAWLKERLAAGDAGLEEFRDPRIGAELFARKLSLSLDAEADAAEILARAEADLDRVSGEIVEAAADYDGVAVPADPAERSALVRRVLDRLAESHPDNDSILAYGRQALLKQFAFVREHDLVTVYSDPYEVAAMPEVHRGVAVAYCDPPGPLESADVQTILAISPTPRDWTPERVDSFFREYNLHMVHNLMVHEAMPGHLLQLQHSRRYQAPTPVRAALWSGSFVEGWAVYAEELMARHAYPGDGDPRAVRMQQLKMQLRMIINAVLDGRIHCHGMTEAEAMALMTDRGFQEDGEAAGKWRRALLSSSQLSTYYVGYVEVSDLVRDVRAEHPQWSQRQVHDAVLAHGSPAARYLRELIA